MRIALHDGPPELSITISEIVTSTATLETALEEVLARLGHASEATVGEAWVELTPGTLTSISRWAATGTTTADGTRVLVGEGIAGCVYATGVPSIVSEQSGSRSLTRERLRSGRAELVHATGLPVFADGRVIAVVTFGSEHPPAPTTEAAELVTTLIAPLGPFIALRLATGDAAADTQAPDAERLAVMGLAASTFVHDFSNMLTAILGYSHALGGDTATPGSDLASLHEAAMRGLDLTRGTLRSLRAAPHSSGATAPCTDVALALERLKPLVSLFAGDRVDVELDVTRPLDDVSVDVAQFEQAILNLTINARDAMPSGGTLTIAARPIGEDASLISRGVRITVSDSGTGMDEETLAAAFTPFFTTKSQGTGLGLHAVKRMVEAAKGSLHVASRPGEGTSLVLDFATSRDCHGLTA